MFKNNFRKYLLADLISQFGAGMTMSAMSWFILDKSGSNQLVAAAFGVNILSGILMSIFAGTIVDKFSKKTTVIFSLLLRAVLVTAPMILLSLYGFNKYFLFLLALNNGLGWNLYFPASKGLLQEITSKKDLIKMNSGAEITMQVGLFSAGAVAGGLYKVFGFNLILILSTILFILGSLLINSIKVEKKIASSEPSASFVQLFKEGISYLASNRFIFLFGLTMFIPFVAASCYSVALPGFVNKVLQSDSSIYGLVSMSYGIGAIIAGLTVMSLSKKFSQKALIIGGFVIGIGCGLVMFLTKSIAVTLTITMLCGICGPGIRTIMYSVIMEIVPKTHLGRIMSVWNILSLTLQVAVTYSIGRTMDNISVSYGFLFYSLIMIIGFVIYYGSSKVAVKKEVPAEDVVA